MKFEKRHDTTDTTDFCPRQLVTDLLRGNCVVTGVMNFGFIGAFGARTLVPQIFIERYIALG